MTTLHDFEGVLGTAFGHLSFGLSQSESHGSWLVCEEVALRSFGSTRRRFPVGFEKINKYLNKNKNEITAGQWESQQQQPQHCCVCVRDLLQLQTPIMSP